jgi:transcriptional regulator with XRE-family HTH domain
MASARMESPGAITRDSAEAKRFRVALVTLRKKRGLRQHDVARLSGVNPNTLAAWEQGRAMWQAVTQLARVAAALEVTPNELFGIVEQNDTDALLQERLRRVVTVLAHHERRLLTVTRALNVVAGARTARSTAPSQEQQAPISGEGGPLSSAAATGERDQSRMVKGRHLVAIEVIRRVHEASASVRQDAQRLTEESRRNMETQGLNRTHR